jgi:hypothetical protein
MLFAEHYLLACLKIEIDNYNFLNLTPCIFSPFERPLKQLCGIPFSKGTTENSNNFFSPTTLEVKKWFILMHNSHMTI